MGSVQDAVKDGHALIRCARAGDRLGMATIERHMAAGTAGYLALIAAQVLDALGVTADELAGHEAAALALATLAGEDT